MREIQNWREQRKSLRRGGERRHFIPIIKHLNATRPMGCLSVEALIMFISGNKALYRNEY
jgi:hypothetical protein